MKALFTEIHFIEQPFIVLHDVERTFNNKMNGCLIILRFHEQDF